MSAFTVTSSQIRAKASELRSLNGQFKSQCGNLEATEGTLNSQWEGEANTAFHNAFLTDKAKFEEFYNLIEKYCVALEEIAAKYEEAESRNADTASRRTY